ncbi:MAG: DUF3800 domain-containing protein [Hoeflea sp.]|uniref:DUF3800 domain-containing protein n=1 Tax=Hoeflea sp. TaxID=1940281 RepID=UPI003EF58189
MHIAIDDTYGPTDPTQSRYVTGARRTHVAVLFDDAQVEEIRSELRNCLEYVNSEGVSANEFHFTEIYNQRGAWKKSKDGFNLAIIAAFAKIYSNYNWPVLVQTIDDRTFEDHGIGVINEKIEGFDLSKREDLSLLFLLLVHVKSALPPKPEKIYLFLDEGRRKAGAKFEARVFGEAAERLEGKYQASDIEPLLQIADFLAFAINRNTYLATKPQRTELDDWFIELVGSMRINSPQIKLEPLSRPLTVDTFDELHERDRKSKGLE